MDRLYKVIIRASLDNKGLKAGEREHASAFDRMAQRAQEATKREGQAVLALQKQRSSALASLWKADERAFNQAASARVRSATQSARAIEREEKQLAATMIREARAAQSSRSQAERQLTTDIRRYERERQQIAIQSSRAIQAQAKSEADTRIREGRRAAAAAIQSLRETQAQSRGPGASSSFLAGAAGGVTALVGLSAVNEIRQGAAAWLDYASKLQTTKIAFTTMLGSAQAAQAHLVELQQFALTTPFQFADLIDASQRMQALGFNAKQVIPILTDVGNAVAAAGGGKERLDRVVLALSQIQSKGKVATQELNQLAESGIPAFKILEQTLGKTGAEVRKLVEDGRIGSGIFLTAFQKFSQTNFGGLMEQQSRTFVGALSNIKDGLLFTANTAFEPLFKKINTIAIRTADELTKGKPTIEAAFRGIASGLVEIAGEIGAGLGEALIKGIASRVSDPVGLIKSNLQTALNQVKAIVGPFIDAILNNSPGVIADEARRSQQFGDVLRFQKAFPTNRPASTRFNPFEKPIVIGDAAAGALKKSPRSAASAKDVGADLLRQLQNEYSNLSAKTELQRTAVKLLGEEYKKLDPELRHNILSTSKQIDNERARLVIQAEITSAYKSQEEELSRLADAGKSALGIAEQQLANWIKQGAVIPEVIKQHLLFTATLIDSASAMDRLNHQIELGRESMLLGPVVTATSQLEKFLETEPPEISATTKALIDMRERIRGVADDIGSIFARAVDRWSGSFGDFFKSIGRGFADMAKQLIGNAVFAGVSSSFQRLFGLGGGGGGMAFAGGLGGGIGGIGGGSGAGPLSGILSALTGGGGLSAPASASGSQQTLSQIASIAQGNVVGGGGIGGAIGGAGKFSLSGLGAGFAPLIPLLGASLGASLGGSSRTGSILGGAGGLIGGLGLAAALSPGLALGVGGALSSIGLGGLGTFFSATSGLALLGPIAAVAAPLLIGALILAKNSARRKDERTRDAMAVSAREQAYAVLSGAQSGQLSISQAKAEWDRIKSWYFSQAATLKDSKTRRHAEDWWRNDLEPTLWPQIEAAAKQAQVASTFSSAFVPTFKGGGVFNSNRFIPGAANGLLGIPGVFDRRDDMLMRVSRGEHVAIMNPDQFSRIGGRRTFQAAGVPALAGGGVSGASDGGTQAPIELTAIFAFDGDKIVAKGLRSSDNRKFIISEIRSDFDSQRSDGLLGDIRLGLSK